MSKALTALWLYVTVRRDNYDLDMFQQESVTGGFASFSRMTSY